MIPLELVQLSPLMEYTQGHPEIAVALIDGPVALDHPELSQTSIRQIHGPLSGACALAESFACNLGTSWFGGACDLSRLYFDGADYFCGIVHRPIHAEHNF